VAQTLTSDGSHLDGARRSAGKTPNRAGLGSNLGEDLAQAPSTDPGGTTGTNPLTCTDTNSHRSRGAPHALRDEETVGSDPAILTRRPRAGEARLMSASAGS